MDQGTPWINEKIGLKGQSLRNMNAISLLRKTLPLLLILSLLSPLYAAESAIMISVTDGDMLRIFYNGKVKKVRLIGIDAPESKVNPKAEKDANRSGEDLKKSLDGEKSHLICEEARKPGDGVSIEL
jgi:micrococcal nuclease